MFKNTKAFTSFSTNDIAEAQAFYQDLLGLEVEKTPEGLDVHLAGGGKVFIYPKPDHQAATFTVLNFSVDDITAAVDDLIAKGIVFEQYTGQMQTDAKGILHSQGHGPKGIAWFKDNAGNFIAVMQEK